MRTTGTLIFVLSAAILLLPGTSTAQSVYIADSEGEVNFGAYIRAAFGKWKVPVQVVSDPDKAQYKLQASGSSRKGQWHEGWLTQRGEKTSAAVEMVDRCGNIVWTEAAGDRSRRMDMLVGPFSKQGPKKVADRIAKRLKADLKKKKLAKPAESCAEE